MKKVLLTSAAVLAVFAAAPAFAQGENPANSNQLTQKTYVSWADAAAEANKQVDAHSAEIAAEAQNDASVKAAASELAKAQDTVGHNHESDVAAAQAKYDAALTDATNTVRNKYIQNLQNTYIESAKAEGRYYDETGVEANRTNEQRIEDDLVANGKKAPSDKTTPSQEDVKKATDSADKAKKAEAKTEAAKANKADSKEAAKTLPNTAAVK